MRKADKRHLYGAIKRPSYIPDIWSLRVINYQGNSWIIAYFTRPFSEHEERAVAHLIYIIHLQLAKHEPPVITVNTVDLISISVRVPCICKCVMVLASKMEKVRMRIRYDQNKLNLTNDPRELNLIANGEKINRYHVSRRVLITEMSLLFIIFLDIFMPLERATVAIIERSIRIGSFHFLTWICITQREIPFRKFHWHNFILSTSFIFVISGSKRSRLKSLAFSTSRKL